MKKNTRKNHYNGKNIFGQSCHTSLVEDTLPTPQGKLVKWGEFLLPVTFLD